MEQYQTGSPPLPPLPPDGVGAGVGEAEYKKYSKSITDS